VVLLAAAPVPVLVLVLAAARPIPVEDPAADSAAAPGPVARVPDRTTRDDRVIGCRVPEEANVNVGAATPSRAPSEPRAASSPISLGSIGDHMSSTPARAAAEVVSNVAVTGAAGEAAAACRPGSLAAIAAPPTR
jgi:hypothetical protein